MTVIEIVNEAELMHAGIERAIPGQTSEWYARYRAASRALSSVSSMRAEAHRIHRIAGDDRATLRVIAGERPAHASERGPVVAFSGSFNPLTTAHIRLVEAALAHGFGAALWVISMTSVDKERVTRAAVADRVAQMRAYLRTTQRQGLALVNRGLYYEQARLLCKRLPGAQLTLLVGYDKVAQIFDPQYYRDRDAALRALFQYARLLVAPRAGAGEADLTALMERPENAQFASHVTYLSTSHEMDAESSTAARAAAASGRVGELLRLAPPEGVALADTGAFEPATATGRAIIDRYSQRLLWLRGLELE